MYSKQTETAIAAASRLAEVYDGGKTRLSVTEIANSRGLQRPFLAKILTVLSQAGLVSGTPGPGGGFALSKPPGEIVIFDIYKLFENQQVTNDCPYGGGVCGSGSPCPLHEQLIDVQSSVHRLLHETTLERFEDVDQSCTIDPPSKSQHAIGRRRSFQPRRDVAPA